MAQLGSVLVWGTRGRRFKSCQPDKKKDLLMQVFLFVRQLSQQDLGGGRHRAPDGSCQPDKEKDLLMQVFLFVWQLSQQDLGGGRHRAPDGSCQPD